MLSNEITVTLTDVELQGILATTKKVKRIVVFSHGSGSGRQSPRNQFVAKRLQQANCATLLTDLLTQEEDENFQTRFDIELLTERLISIIHWIKGQEDLQNLSIGLFGASTGAAAALKCALYLQEYIDAVVSRGGRPDLAMPLLVKVQAPTLLIVGGDDHEVIKLNEQAYEQLICQKNLVIIPNASHLFSETGALEKVADLACEWFTTYLKVTK